MRNLKCSLNAVHYVKLFVLQYSFHFIKIRMVCKQLAVYSHYSKDTQNLWFSCFVLSLNINTVFHFQIQYIITVKLSLKKNTSPETIVTQHGHNNLKLSNSTDLLVRRIYCKCHRDARHLNFCYTEWVQVRLWFPPKIINWFIYLLIYLFISTKPKKWKDKNISL